MNIQRSDLHIKLVFKTEHWSSQQRRQFMDMFTDSMDKLSVSLWAGTLRQMPRGLAYQIEDNPSDAPLFRLSFAPGYGGDVLAIMAHMPVPEKIIQHLRVRHQDVVETLRAKAEKSWTVKYFIPLVDRIFNVPPEERGKEAILEALTDKEHKELSEKLPVAARQVWGQFASVPLTIALLQATLEALEKMELSEPLEPMLIQANGQTKVLELKGVADRHVQAPSDHPPRPVGRAVLKA